MGESGIREVNRLAGAAIPLLAAGLLAGCAVVNKTDSGDAVSRVEGYHSAAAKKIVELDAVRAEMEKTLGKYIAYGKDASSLAGDSEKFPEGFDNLLDKQTAIENGLAAIDGKYRSRDIIPEFNGYSDKATEINNEIDALFDKASKSIIVRYVAVREAKLRNQKLLRENKGRKDEIWNRIEGARRAFDASKDQIAMSRETIDANLAKLKSIIASMPEAFTIQCFDDNDREIYRIKPNDQGEIVSRPDFTPRMGDWHEFKYWSVEKNGPEYTGFGRDKFKEAPRKLFAVFAEKTVSVTFYLDPDKRSQFGSEAKLQRTLGAKYERPAKDPVRWGYRFAGWRKDGESDFFTGFGTPATASAVFVASWEEAPFEVTFHDADGAVSDIRNLRLSDAIPAVSLAAEGYGYTGWSREKGGKPIAANAKLRDCIKEGAKALDLYALRTPTGYKARFVGRDGRTVVAEVPGSAVKKVAAPKAPAITGHKFDGWFLADGSQFKDGPITGDITVQAKYSPVTYKASFVIAETGEALGTVEFSAEKPLALPNLPRIPGAAWSMEGEGHPLKPVDFTASQNIKVYAVRTVRYSFWNWSQKLMETNAVYGSKINPPDLIDLATGKKHNPEGWSFASNDSKTSFIDFDKFPMVRNKQVFRAVWPQDLWDENKIPKVVTLSHWNRMKKEAEEEEAARRDAALRQK